MSRRQDGAEASHIRAEIDRLMGIGEQAVNSANDYAQNPQHRCTAAARADLIVLALLRLGADTSSQRFCDLERNTRYAVLDARSALRDEQANAIVDEVRAGNRAAIV